MEKPFPASLAKGNAMNMERRVRVIHVLVVESILDRLRVEGLISGGQHEITDKGRLLAAGLAKYMSKELFVSTLVRLSKVMHIGDKKTCKIIGTIARNTGCIADLDTGGEEEYYSQLGKLLMEVRNDLSSGY